MGTTGSWFPGWHWGWLVAGLLLLAAPLVFARSHRLAYLAFWCTVLAAAAGAFWVIDQKSDRNWEISFARYTPALGERRSGEFWSCSGEVGFAYRYLGFVRGLRPEDWAPGMFVDWGRDTDFVERSPEWRPPFFRLWGFQFVSSTEVPAGVGGNLSWRGVVVPAWFAMLVLAMPIALYARQFRRRRKIARWLAAGCCGKCGYDLRAQNPGEKCPECGTVKPELPENAQLSTAAETQGKQL